MSLPDSPRRSPRRTKRRRRDNRRSTTSRAAAAADTTSTPGSRVSAASRPSSMRDSRSPRRRRVRSERYGRVAPRSGSTSRRPPRHQVTGTAYAGRVRGARAAGRGCRCRCRVVAVAVSLPLSCGRENSGGRCRPAGGGRPPGRDDGWATRSAIGAEGAAPERPGTCRVGRAPPPAQAGRPARAGAGPSTAWLCQAVAGRRPPRAQGEHPDRAAGKRTWDGERVTHPVCRAVPGPPPERGSRQHPRCFIVVWPRTGAGEAGPAARPRCRHHFRVPYSPRVAGRQIGRAGGEHPHNKQPGATPPGPYPPRPPTGGGAPGARSIKENPPGREPAARLRADGRTAGRRAGPSHAARRRRNDRRDETACGGGGQSSRWIAQSCTASRVVARRRRRRRSPDGCKVRRPLGPPTGAAPRSGDALSARRRSAPPEGLTGGDTQRPHGTQSPTGLRRGPRRRPAQSARLSHAV